MKHQVEVAVAGSFVVLEAVLGVTASVALGPAAARVGGPHAAWWASIARVRWEQLRGRHAAAEAARWLGLGLEIELAIAFPQPRAPDDRHPS